MTSVRNLEEMLGRWRDAGLLSAEQARLILEMEQAEPRPTKTALVAEILGYLGGALALVAAIVLVGQFWTQLEVWARIALIGVTAAFVGGVAYALGGSASAAIVRLSAFLHVLSTLALAVFVGLLLAEVADASEEVTLTWAAGSALVNSAWLWWRRKGTLQQAALFVALAVTAMSALNLFDALEAEFAGLGLWGLGLAWGLLAWGGLVPPRDVGYFLAAAALLVGSMIFATPGQADLFLGLATAAALVAAGVSLGSIAVLAVGTVGIFVFTPQVIFAYFGETAGGALALLVTGVALLTAAAAIARVGRRMMERPR
jgi:hypothetical protein